MDARDAALIALDIAMNEQVSRAFANLCVARMSDPKDGIDAFARGVDIAVTAYADAKNVINTKESTK